MSTDPSVPSPASPGPATAVPPRANRAASFTRLAAAWWALVFGLLVLIILLIFVAQNTDNVAVHFLMFDWNLPVGVGYLLAAVAGATTTVLVGAARMIQLRRAAKKNLRPL
ncbi:LapA family protein [Mycobacterium sp. Marseille-P9652]|uniref:LapA family protein n=1 Tax=Mycobacterium sp. Marseille-P9652 TaxID=2654950 RepID=UPI0012E7C53F|nr:lipopolysaccharide assembly protein LapA domain-containing protein [Mycobacterium sp. Marseille-P9652]